MPRPASDRDIKEAVRERDGYSCVDCGMTEEGHFEKYGRTLDVHRITPEFTWKHFYNKAWVELHERKNQKKARATGHNAS